jgi:16S rRNA processing protein RimM
VSGLPRRSLGEGGSRDSGVEAHPDWDDLILVGVVARTHGNKGHVIVNPHTDFMEERFQVGARFEVRRIDGQRQVLVVTAARIHQGRPIVGFEGVDTIGDAETYQGAELRIHADEQRALPAGHYYHHQLVGCEAVTAAGERIGRVVGVEGEMGQSRLIVAGTHRRHEIPLAEDICTVDVAGRRIIVRPPEGLLEL